MDMQDVDCEMRIGRGWGWPVLAQPPFRNRRQTEEMIKSIREQNLPLSWAKTELQQQKITPSNSSIWPFAKEIEWSTEKTPTFLCHQGWMVWSQRSFLLNELDCSSRQPAAEDYYNRIREGTLWRNQNQTDAQSQILVPNDEHSHRPGFRTLFWMLSRDQAASTHQPSSQWNHGKNQTIDFGGPYPDGHYNIIAIDKRTRYSK